MVDGPTNDAGEPVCRCGHDKRHFWVRPAYRYGLLGSVAQIVGMTAVPSRIDLTCGVCGDTVSTITDPARLRKYRSREPKPEER